MSSGFGNTAQLAFLALVLQNTAWANVGTTAGLQPASSAGSAFVALSTGTLSGASTQSTTEAAYTGYSRVGVARSSAGWATSGSSPTTGANVGAVTFGACTAGTETETNCSVGTLTSGTGSTLWWGALTSSLAVSSGITPSFAASALALLID